MKELYFKIIFFILFIISNFVRICFYKSKKGVETKFFESKGREILLVVLVYVCFIIPSLLYVFTGWIDIFMMNLPSIVRFTGVSIIVFGTLFFLWTHKSLGKNFSPVLGIKEKHKLVSVGPYKRIRHPMYSAIYILIFGFWILSSNWFVGLVTFSGFSTLYISRVRREENLMIKEFGNKYRDYIRNTRRLLPKFSL